MSYKNTLSSIFDHFPSNLSILLSNRHLSSNLNRPYFFWTNEKKQSELFMVIDEQAQATDITRYNSRILLTSDTIVTQTSQGIHHYKYPSLNLELNHQTVEDNKGKVLTGISLFILFTLLSIFIFKPLVVSAIILVIVSIIAFISHSLMSQSRASYKSLLQLGIFSSTTPLCILYFIPMLHAKLQLFPGSILIFILFYLAAFYEVFIYKKPS
jgi:hypothetical protein